MAVGPVSDSTDGTIQTTDHSRDVNPETDASQESKIREIAIDNVCSFPCVAYIFYANVWNFTYLCISFLYFKLGSSFPFIISGTSFVICPSPFVFIFLFRFSS
jgi:hypothetical protein